VQRTKNLEILEQRIDSLESRIPYIAICPAKPEELEKLEQDHQTHNKEKDDNDEDIDLFGSESEVGE